MEKLNTPVLFIVFNRPETTSKVFEKIRKAKPQRLYIAADGPRENKKGDIEKCEEVRKVAANVDWECDVKTLFRDGNLGCKYAVSSAIDWFFKNEEMGIILEDDCLPGQSFFTFCEELLYRYKDDDRIMHINGNNFGANGSDFYSSNHSYHFGRMPQVWGWATWRESWNRYDSELSNVKIDELSQNPYWNTFYKKENLKNNHFQRFEKAKNKTIDTWDYQWQFSVISNNGLTIVSKKNLIKNIGFGSDATHTKQENSSKAVLDTNEIEFPLRHPRYVIPDSNIDFWFQENMLGTSSFTTRAKDKIASLIKAKTL